MTMVGLFALWLPILLSAVFVFIVSSVIHMVSPWHKSDYPKLESEDKMMEVLRPLWIVSHLALELRIFEGSPVRGVCRVKH